MEYADAESIGLLIDLFSFILSPLSSGFMSTQSSPYPLPWWILVSGPSTPVWIILAKASTNFTEEARAKNEYPPGQGIYEDDVETMATTLR
jgi:hypothetical protein